MGFRLSKSFKVAPGVRMTVSKSGVGYSVGGKGVRVTKTARGRVVGTVGAPGTGLSRSTTLAGGRGGGNRTGAARTAAAAQPASPRPGLLAPKAEKQLYKALLQERGAMPFAQIAAEHPNWAPLCATLDGLLAYQAKELDRAEQALTRAFASGLDAAVHPFMRRYASASTVTLELAEGVRVTLPVGREAVGLTLAELYQATGRLEQAIDVVEQLEPRFSAAVSLAELYSDAGHHEAVVELTNGLANESDAHAFLLVLRARALRETGTFDAAREALKEALRRRSVDAEIRRRAYLERANTYLLQGRRSQARKDLERILAEDADYPGLRETLAALEQE